MPKIPRRGSRVPAQLRSVDICGERDIAAHSGLVSTKAAEQQNGKPPRILGLSGMFVVAIIITLSIYSIVRYLL